MVQRIVSLCAGVLWCAACLIASELHAVQFNVASASEGAVVVADSSYGRFKASEAIDGIRAGGRGRPEANRWHASITKPHPHWIWVRFHDRARIERVVIHRSELAAYPVDFIAEYSPDGGVTFLELFSVTNNYMTQKQFAKEFHFVARATDNFRLRILRSACDTETNRVELSELEVFGEFIGAVASHTVDLKSEPSAMSKATGGPTGVPGLKVSENSEEIEFRSRWLRVGFSRNTPRLTSLCWDSLGEGQVTNNLLKTATDGGVMLIRKPVFEDSKPLAEVQQLERQGNLIRYSQILPGGQRAWWQVRIEAKSFQVNVSLPLSNAIASTEPLGLRFSFDASKTPVAPLAAPRQDITTPLPCLLHAADYGTLLVRPTLPDRELHLAIETTPRGDTRWNAVVQGIESPRTLDGLFVQSSGTYRLGLEFTVENSSPLQQLAAQDPRLRHLPRTWLNVFQYKPEFGILANNTLSDHAVFCMYTFTDPAVFTPALPGNIEAIQLSRESLDRYFAGAKGYGVGKEDSTVDTYPSLLIAAWDVIRVSGDRALLQRWLPALEKIAGKAESQDRDGNGLPESKRSGLRGVVQWPTGNWWDVINFGHEDAYSCALSYRAFKCLADLERLAGRLEQAARFEKRAARIHDAYVPAFYNQKTGVIAGWRDIKGELHDYWFVFVNGIAISYGLVPDELANRIVDRIEAKMKAVGYNRFDLGLPGNLVPIPKSEYAQKVLGSPKSEDGSDTFGQYQNGSATACFAYFYIQALFQLGRRAEAERILWPMMQTFARGGFQNGVGHGGDWRRWDGRPSGYEGFLADAYYAQLALFTGHYGIGFGPDGFYLEKWSPFIGKSMPLGLKYMGQTVATLECAPLPGSPAPPRKGFLVGTGVFPY